MSFPPPAGYASMEIQIVLDWHEALNSGDVERLVNLSHPEVEVGGPRGAAYGAQILREWVDRADVRLEPLRTFHRDDTVVVEQEAEWRSAAPGAIQTVASVFVVEDGVVKSVVRHPDLAPALRAADLDETDERPQAGR